MRLYTLYLDLRDPVVPSFLALKCSFPPGVKAAMAATVQAHTARDTTMVGIDVDFMLNTFMLGL